MLTARNDYAVIAKHGILPGTLYSVADAAILKLKHIEVVKSDGGESVRALYDGGDAAAAITLADYNGFPIGSHILDIQAYKWHIKTGAETWKSSEAMA